MFTRQLDWTASSNQLVGPGQWTGPKGVGGDEASFALLYETVLALTIEQSAEAGAPGTPLDDAECAEATPFDSTEGSLGTPGFRSTMGRYLSSKGHSQTVASPFEWSSERQLLRGLPFAASPARSPGTAAPGISSDGSLTQVQSSAGSLNKTELSEWMDAHALSQSSHHCAMYCRLGFEAAGLTTSDRPRSGDAADYGPYLLRHGAQTVPADSYIPQVGDVVVFDRTDQHPYGHIETFDGHQWVSDFMQHSFSPYRDASSTPPFTIYRLA